MSIKKYQCGRCLKIFRKKYNYDVHMERKNPCKVVNQATPLRCDQCGLLSECSEDYKKHIDAGHKSTVSVKKTNDDVGHKSKVSTKNTNNDAGHKSNVSTKKTNDDVGHKSKVSTKKTNDDVGHKSKVSTKK